MVTVLPTKAMGHVEAKVILDVFNSTPRHYKLIIKWTLFTLRGQDICFEAIQLLNRLELLFYYQSCPGCVGSQFVLWRCHEAK